MRPIKFRAEYEGKVYPVTNIDFANKLGMQVGLSMPSGNTIVLHVDNVHLIQFTGLLDKNGKEIYEGDILRVGEMEDLVKDPDATVHEVKWFGDTGYPAFDLVHWDGECNALSEISQADVWNCEVIGNIYESPELSNL